MYLQEYRIHLINNQVLKAAEERHIPEDKRLHNRFRVSKPDDVLTIGTEETAGPSSRSETFCIFPPVRNLTFDSIPLFSERLIDMFVKVIRIHFVNGEVLPIAECMEDEGDSKILERYRKALPDGLLYIGNEECGEMYIPTSNILYISVDPDDEE